MGNVPSDEIEHPVKTKQKQNIEQKPKQITQQKQNIQQNYNQNIQQKQNTSYNYNQNTQYNQNYKQNQSYNNSYNFNQTPHQYQNPYQYSQTPMYQQQMNQNQMNPYYQQQYQQYINQMRMNQNVGMNQNMMNVNDIQRNGYVNKPPQHALPQFPNRTQLPTDQMVQEFHKAKQTNQYTYPENNLQMMAYPSSSKGMMFDDRYLDTMIEKPLTNIELRKQDFQDRIEEYEKNYSKEEEEFEEHERNRRTKFKSYMDRKKEKLYEAIKKFEQEYNPYEILGLENGDLDMSNIRKAYKKMALKYHPDKAGEEYTEQFQIITQSYIYLLKKAEDNEKKISKNYDENIQTSSSYNIANKIMERTRDLDIIQKEEKPKQTRVSKSKKPSNLKETRINDFIEKKSSNEVDIMDVNQNNFNINKFNEIFEKYKVDDDTQNKGYGDWLKNDMDIENDDNELFGKNMSKDIFNAHFDTIKSKKNKQYDYPILPDAFDSSSKVNCANIGNANNFSGNKYTDIKQAYTQDNVLIDPNSVKIKKYKNLQELENERSRISYEADPQMKSIYDEYERRQQEEEEDRLRYTKDYENRLNEHHHYVSKKLHINGKKIT